MILFYHKPRLFSRALRILFYLYFYGVRRVFAVLFCSVRGKRSQREGNALFDDFWYFWSRKSTIKEKFLYVSSRANDVRPYHDPKCRQQPKEKSNLHSLFLLQNQAQKKKLSKRKRRNKLSRSAEHDESYACPRLGDADTHAPRMCQFPPLSVDDTAF